MKSIKGRLSLKPSTEGEFDKISCIRQLRALTDLSLKEANQTIEAMLHEDIRLAIVVNSDQITSFVMAKEGCHLSRGEVVFTDMTLYTPERLVDCRPKSESQIEVELADEPWEDEEYL